MKVLSRTEQGTGLWEEIRPEAVLYRLRNKESGPHVVFRITLGRKMLKLLVRSLGRRTGVLGRGEVVLVSLGVSGVREGEVWQTEGRKGLVASLAVAVAAVVDREGQAGVVVIPIHGHASLPC